MPKSLAACQIVVPSGTVTSWPSIVRLTVRISVGAGGEIATVAPSSPRLDRITSRKGNASYGFTGRVPPAADPRSDQVVVYQIHRGRGRRSTDRSWHPAARVSASPFAPTPPRGTPRGTGSGGRHRPSSSPRGC